MINIPKVKLGVVAVSRDCFPIDLSERRRAALMQALKARGVEAVEIQTTVENELDAKKALSELSDKQCNALVMYLGNFGPEGPETLVAQNFDGPVMFVAAAEEDIAVLASSRGDAYCGLLNASYNLGIRGVKAFIPEEPVGMPEELAAVIQDEFLPVACALIGVKKLKIFGFGPRPTDFVACNAPIAPLFDLGVEIQENSELDLFMSFNAHENDPRIPEIVKDMEAELGDGNKMPEILPKLAQYEITLLDWIENNRGMSEYVAIAGKCWPAFQEAFGFVPCYVNSRLTGRGIPVSCEVDIYGALSEFIAQCVTGQSVTLLDINNTVPKEMYQQHIQKQTGLAGDEVFMGFHLQGAPGKRRDEIPAHHEPQPGKRRRARHHPRHHRGRHRAVRHYAVPFAGRRQVRAARLCGRGQRAGCRPLLVRRHRRHRHPGNAPVLPPCAGGGPVPAPRRAGV